MTFKVVLVKPEEIAALEQKVSDLNAEVQQLRRDVSSLRQYADLSLLLMDQLRQARSILQIAGLDTSFITSLH